MRPLRRKTLYIAILFMPLSRERTKYDVMFVPLSRETSFPYDMIDAPLA